MSKKFTKKAFLIIITFILAALWPIDVIAENVNPGATMKINTITELPTLSDTSNVNNQVVVIYKTANSMNIQSLNLTTDEIIGGKNVSDRVDLLELDPNIDMNSFIKTLNENPNVMAADKNKIVRKAALTNDPYIQNGYAWQFSGIGADETWNQVANSDPVVVAVLDTGVNANHPDLQGRLVDGYDYLTQSTNIVDHDGHGTCVSGCISAIANNNLGIAGVTGTANVKIASYCIGSEYYDDSTICAALLACADRPDIDVINMSYGGYEKSSTEQSALEYASTKGKILVASSGNEGDDRKYAGQYSYPASYDKVISVAATNSRNQVSSFSQYNDLVDLAAPGEAIYTTSKTGGYEFIDGTSFSSPIVAGACAVLLAANPSLSADKVETILKNTALDLGQSGKDNYSGYGLIQLDQALQEGSSEIPLTAILLNKSTLSLTPNSSEQLTVSYIPIDTTAIKTVTWSSANPNVATVNSNGMVTSLSEGMTTITAKVGSITTTCTVTVTTTEPSTIDCLYRTHIQNTGWQPWRYNGDVSGTSGQGLRLEAIEIKLDPAANDLGIEYQTHVQNIGWQPSQHDGDLSGTSGEGLRLEAIRIHLTGSDAGAYAVYYRVHAQNIGWMDWAKDGEASGTAGFGYRLEAIEINVVPYGSPAPGPTEQPFIDANVN
ncbi:S8 family serine peptidase [Acetobacterium woodii]|nr:S8 family serine peptidase [Acetobacterium woodii]